MMVICKFFQAGNCRAGQSCRFEHVYGSRYSYRSNPPAPAPPTVTENELVNLIHNDIQTVLKGKQWILSVYSPFKERHNFPGFLDCSPEEARLFIYEAKANNTTEMAVNYYNKMIDEVIAKYKQLLRPTPEIVKVIKSLYNGEKPNSPFSANESTSMLGCSTNSQNSASSLFRGAVQAGSVFGQSPSAFGEQSKDFFNSAQTNAKSIFAQANESMFGSPQKIESDPSSIFSTESQKVFGTSSQDKLSQNNSPFSNSNSVFQKPTFDQKSNETSNAFQQHNSNAFEQNTKQLVPHDSGVYSNENDLTEDELDQFKNFEFKLGFIPESPPPQSLCL